MDLKTSAKLLEALDHVFKGHLSKDETLDLFNMIMDELEKKGIEIERADIKTSQAPIYPAFGA